MKKNISGDQRKLEESNIIKDKLLETILEELTKNRDQIMDQIQRQAKENITHQKDKEEEEKIQSLSKQLSSIHGTLQLKLEGQDVGEIPIPSLDDIMQELKDVEKLKQRLDKYETMIALTKEEKKKPH